jgi:hypothetical protein
MTLCSLFFDLVVISIMHRIKQRQLVGDKKESESGWLSRQMGAKYAKVAKLLLTLSKSGGLTVSTFWILNDLNNLIESAPGYGSLILGSIATAASLLVLLLELLIWLSLLPASLKQIREVMHEPKVRRRCLLAGTPD